MHSHKVLEFLLNNVFLRNKKTIDCCTVYIITRYEFLLEKSTNNKNDNLHYVEENV